MHHAPTNRAHKEVHQSQLRVELAASHKQQAEEEAATAAAGDTQQVCRGVCLRLCVCVP
jgi:hypothetical protein